MRIWGHQRGPRVSRWALGWLLSSYFILFILIIFNIRWSRSLAFQVVCHELAQELIQSVIKIWERWHNGFLNFVFVLIFEYSPGWFLEFLLIHHLLDLYYLLHGALIIARYLALKGRILPKGDPRFGREWACIRRIVVIASEELLWIAGREILHELRALRVSFQC